MTMPEDNADLLIVSDLHVGEGRGDPFAAGAALEDFTSDAAFFRLLIDRHNHLSERAPERRWALVINGDLFEFMQVVSLPDPEDEPEAYRQLVAQRMKTHPNILLYGLGTEPDASAWKVRRIARGHAWFFRALAWWLAQGHGLAVVKGNHDVELHYPQVQAAVRAEIVRAAEDWAGAGGARRPPGVLVPPPPVEAVREAVEQIAFVPLAYYRAGKVYVEHGTQYEPLNAFGNFLRPTLPPDDEPERIELPLGSLIVRYALNRLEAIAPLFENIRPITAGFGVLVRQHLWLTIRTVFEHAGPLSTAIVNTLELHGRDTPRAQAHGEAAAAHEMAAGVEATYPDSLPPKAAAAILGLRSQPALSRANSLMISAGGLAALLLLAVIALALAYLVTASLSRAFDFRAFVAALGLGVSGLLGGAVLVRAGRGVYRRNEGAARIGWLVAVILLGASALRLALSLADVFNQRGGPGARLLGLNLLALAGALAARALLRDILYGRLRRLRVHWRSREQLNWVERWLYAIGLVERRLITGFARIAFGRSGLAVLQLFLVALVGVTVLGFVVSSVEANSLNTVCVLAGLALSIFSGAAWGWRALALGIGLLAVPLLAPSAAAAEAGRLSAWEALAALALACAALAALLYAALRYAGRRGEATVKQRYLAAAMHRVSEALARRGLNVPYFITGHDHNLGAHAYPSGETYLDTGCWLPIYEQHAGKSHSVLRLGFVQVEGLDGDDVRARLYVWDDARRVAEPFDGQS